MANDKRQELLAEAKELNIDFPKNITDAKLEQLIQEAYVNSSTEPDDDPELQDNSRVHEEPEVELEIEIPAEEKVDPEEALRKKLEEEYSMKLAKKLQELEEAAALNDNTLGPDRKIAQAKLRAVKEATKLVRVVVTNRNPLKASWEGEIITVSNDLIGLQRKYVPFNLEQGYHLPKIIVNALRDKECTVFVNAKNKMGEKIKKGKLIKEYAIEELPPLTEEELKQLAADQRARGALDDED